MDHRLLLSPDRYWQDNHFAPSQPWIYSTATAGMPGLHGFNPGLFHPHSYPVFEGQSPETMGALYVPNYDGRPTHAQQSLQRMPGYHTGHEAGAYFQNHSAHPYPVARLQKQTAFSPTSINQPAHFGGMMQPVHSPHSYIPQQVPHYGVPTLQPHSLEASTRLAGTVPNHYHSRIAPARFQPSQAATPPSPQLPRGPPLKPKRSGHAIWVGNVPLGASIEDLKDHFSWDATASIESVFLMSRSNCAFVNYTTAEACLAAVERFNHSLFGSVRLLCRIRRDPSSPREGSQSLRSVRQSPMTTESTLFSAESSSDPLDDVKEASAGLGISQDYGPNTPDTSPLPPQPPFPIDAKPSDRYFMLKSLTKEDLHDSLMNGTWETQLHNQQVLHEAFCEAANVYLVFSVNKSGEYFGYARMIFSPFNDSSQQSSSSSTEVTSNDNSRMTKTPATATAPKGHIIDDPTRGTLFWEAEHNSTDSIVSSNGVRPSDIGGHPWSRPFQIEWLSVRRVTFQRTKGMRNAWNANKEVKVARDGTELETEIGKNVVALFHERYDDVKKVNGR